MTQPNLMNSVYKKGNKMESVSIFSNPEQAGTLFVTGPKLLLCLIAVVFFYTLYRIK